MIVVLGKEWWSLQLKGPIQTLSASLYLYTIKSFYAFLNHHYKKFDEILKGQTKRISTYTKKGVSLNCNPEADTRHIENLDDNDWCRGGAEDLPLVQPVHIWRRWSWFVRNSNIYLNTPTLIYLPDFCLNLEDLKFVLLLHTLLGVK